MNVVSMVHQEDGLGVVMVVERFVVVFSSVGAEQCPHTTYLQYIHERRRKRRGKDGIVVLIMGVGYL